MKYPKKIVKLPKDMKVGSEIGIVGESTDTFQITEICKNKTGDTTKIKISSGWREPLSKIYLLRDRRHEDAMRDPSSWIDVAIGECDDCGKKFPDSCAHSTKEGVEDSMVCRECSKEDRVKVRI